MKEKLPHATHPIFVHIIQLMNNVYFIYYNLFKYLFTSKKMSGLPVISRPRARALLAHAFKPALGIK